MNGFDSLSNYRSLSAAVLYTCVNYRRFRRGSSKAVRLGHALEDMVSSCDVDRTWSES